MTSLIEHKVMNYLRITYICGSSDEGNEAVGDIPGGPFCFGGKEVQEVDDAVIIWSEWFPMSGNIKVRFSGAYVLGKLTTIGFYAVGIDCSARPERLYQEILSFLNDVCR